MKISIIIPHYNNWCMLNELLESIPKKEGIEVIVIDDHSSNLEKYSEVKEKFPNVLFEQNFKDKKGAGAARNLGLSLASGEWLLFADSDDVFVAGFIEKVASFVDDDSDIVYFIPTSFYENSQQDSTRHLAFKRLILNFLENYNKVNEMKLRYDFAPPWSKLIKRDTVTSNDIEFEEIMVSNDVLFSTKIGFYSKKVSVSTETIYSVRQRKGSLTSIISEKIFLQRFDAWVDKVRFLRTKLSKEEFNLLNISAIYQLIQVLRNKYGFKVLKYILEKCKDEDIPLLDKRLKNPFLTLNALQRYLVNDLKIKKTEIMK